MAEIYINLAAVPNIYYCLFLAVVIIFGLGYLVGAEK